MELRFWGCVGTRVRPYDPTAATFIKMHFLEKKGKEPCKFIIGLLKVHFTGNNNAAKTQHRSPQIFT